MTGDFWEEPEEWRKPDSPRLGKSAALTQQTLRKSQWLRESEVARLRTVFLLHKENISFHLLMQQVYLKPQLYARYHARFSGFKRKQNVVGFLTF